MSKPLLSIARTAVKDKQVPMLEWLMLCAAISAFIFSGQSHSKAVKQDKPDPSMVVVREVAPRIAYRAIPKEELPVSARATLFPAKVFHQTMGTIIEATASEQDLMQRASVGLLVNAKSPLSSTSRLQTALGSSSRSSVGIGGSARNGGSGGGVGGRITSATGQLSSIIPAAIQQTTQPISKPGG